jgi:hypothetical protein
MKNLLYISAFILALSACNNGPVDKTPVYGDVDTSAIAADTLSQKAIETSYEFHKTLVVNSNLVYDVIGSGNSKARGEYMVIKRFNDTGRDTLIRRERKGPILNAWVADIDGNKNNEIYLVADSGAKYVQGVEEWNSGEPILIDLGNPEKLKGAIIESIYFEDNAIIVKAKENNKTTLYYYGVKKGSALQLTNTKTNP